MNVLCVITGRGKSERMPNKNIRILLGKPLIAYTIEKALKSKLCSRVAVSTDDAKIASVAREYGIDDVIMRPAKLALDTSPIDDALRHAVRFFECKKKFVADIVVLLQANVPVRKDGEIDEVIRKLMKKNDATAVATAYIVNQHPEWMKIIDPKTGRIAPFMGVTDLYRKQDLRELYLLDGAVIAVKTQVLMDTEGISKAHGYLGDKVDIIVQEAKYSVEIDEENDFELAKYYLLEEQNGQKKESDIYPNTKL